MAIRVVVVLDNCPVLADRTVSQPPQSYTCMKQRGVWWVSISNRVPSRILYVKWQHSEINGFINIKILLVHCSFYFAAKVWSTKCWPRPKLLNMKKKNPWTTDVYFWNNTGKLCCYLVIYWENSDTCIFGINIEFFFTMSAISLRSIVYTRIAFSNKRRSIPRKEDNLQSLAYCIKNQNSTSTP